MAVAQSKPTGKGEAPIVSVLIRSIGRPTLVEALASVAEQTYRRIEVVVIDALGTGHPPLGPTCGTFPVRVVSLGSPLRRSAAANAGLVAARGDFLIFLDDDDLFDPGHVGGLVAALLGAPDSLVAYAGVRAIDEGGTVIRIFSRPFSPKALRTVNYIPLHAALFSHEVVQAGLRFDEALDVYEDWDFFLQLAQRTPFVHVSRVTASYRLGGGSRVGLSAEEPARARGRRQVLEKWKGVWSAPELDELFRTVDVQARDHAVELRKKDALLEEKAEHMAALDQMLAGILHSKSWVLTEPLRWIARQGRALAKRLLGNPLVASPIGRESIKRMGSRGIGPVVHKEAPLISVVLPVYQACRGDRHFLAEAVRSVSEQTYENLELIIVDDGSTDGTRALCEELMADETRIPIRYRLKQNAGQSSARNVGISLSNGEFVSFIDQDDVWFARKLEIVASYLAEDVDVVYTDADTIDPTGEVLLVGIHRIHGCGAPHPKESIEDILFRDIFVMPGLMTVRRDLLLKIGGFDEGLSGYEDDDLFLRLWENGSVRYVPFSTLKWRMHEQNYSQSTRMVRSRSYYWKKLLANYTDGGRNGRRAHRISLRFAREFLCQAGFQLFKGIDMYRENLEAGKEVIPTLSWRARIFFGSVVTRWFRLAERWAPARSALNSYLSSIYSGRN